MDGAVCFDFEKNCYTKLFILFEYLLLKLIRVLINLLILINY